MSGTAPALGADDFDGWCADMANSVAVDEIHQRHLGLQRATLEEAAALDPGGDAQPAP